MIAHKMEDKEGESHGPEIYVLGEGKAKGAGETSFYMIVTQAMRWTMARGVRMRRARRASRPTTLQAIGRNCRQNSEPASRGVVSMSLRVGLHGSREWGMLAALLTPGKEAC